MTSADGTFAKSWTSAARVKGDFVVTATGYAYDSDLTDNTRNLLASNPVASATWARSAAVTGLPNGQYKDTSSLTVGPIILSGPNSRQGAGFVRLIGVSNPNSTMEIYGRAAGSTTGLVLVSTVVADGNGDFQSDEYITGTTTFTAKSGGQYSPAVTVAVTAPPKPVVKVASAKVSAKALGKGKVSVSVNGAPNKKGTITLYMNNKKVKSWTSNAYGDGALTIKTGRGVKTFKAGFSTSGYKAGTSSTVKVTVK